VGVDLGEVHQADQYSGHLLQHVFVLQEPLNGRGVHHDVAQQGERVVSKLAVTLVFPFVRVAEDPVQVLQAGRDDVLRQNLLHLLRALLLSVHEQVGLSQPLQSADQEALPHEFVLLVLVVFQEFGDGTQNVFVLEHIVLTLLV